MQSPLRDKRSRQRRCDPTLPMTERTTVNKSSLHSSAFVPGHSLSAACLQCPTSSCAPLLPCGLHRPASLPWCSGCAACVACPHSPSALPQVAVQLLRMLSSQAAHLRGLSEELAVQQWLAEVDGRTEPDAVPAQASPQKCCFTLANSKRQAQRMRHSQCGAVVGLRLHTWAPCCTMHAVWAKLVSLTCSQTTLRLVVGGLFLAWFWLAMRTLLIDQACQGSRSFCWHSNGARTDLILTSWLPAAAAACETPSGRCGLAAGHHGAAACQRRSVHSALKLLGISRTQ